MPTTITNKFNLPEHFVDAVKYDSHPVAGDISISALIDAPQIRILRRKLEIEEDVVDRVFMLFGTAVHNILERANIKDHRKRAFITVIDTLKDDFKASGDPLIEKAAGWLFKYMQRVFPELQDRYLFEFTLHTDIDGTIVYGTLDLYDKIEKRLYDYKVTSVWSYIIPEARNKWRAQQNSYAHMLRLSGYEVNEAYIIAIFRDWTKSKVSNERDYPERPIMEIPIPLESMETMSKYFSSRVKAHRAADQGNVVECSAKERWATMDTWALKQPGAKRAIPKMAHIINEAEAQKLKAQNEHKYPGLYIETRKGESRRCNEFCVVRHVCEQRKKYQ